AVCQGQLPPTLPSARHFAADSAHPPAEFTAKCRAHELAARGVVGQCRARGLTARGLTAQCRGGATGGAGYPHGAAVRRRRPAHPFHPGAMSLSSAALPEARTEPSVLTALRTPRLLVREVLAGLVVALALIPEAISFSIIAGVDPRVGLFSSFVMAVAIAFVGGRPAMITAATAAVAVVIAPVMREHGLDHLIATVILGGVFQVVLAWLGVARLMRFIPRSVMVGFVNSLAVLIFMAQLPHLVDVPWVVYALVGGGLLVMVLWPRVTKAVPAPLVSIVLVTAVVVVFALQVPTVGDEGELPRSLPELFVPDVPLTWETFTLLAPYALAMALVGLMESLMTAKLVDDITD